MTNLTQEAAGGDLDLSTAAIPVTIGTVFAPCYDGIRPAWATASNDRP